MSTARLGWLKKSGTTSNSSSRKSSPAPSSSAGPSASSSKSYNVPPTTSTTLPAFYKDEKNRVVEYKDAEDICPICKSDRYLNPKLRLLVSTCYHKMCEACIDRLYTLGPAPCPICQTVLRKAGFQPQTFEDLKVEEEVAIRRRIGKYFNKRREDFVDEVSWNNYLEEVEDITFNLINKIDVATTEKRILAYRKMNEDLIESNNIIEENDSVARRAAEEQEKEEREWRKAQAKRALEEEERVKKESEGRLIRELEFSSAPASKIMSKNAKLLEQSTSALLLPASLLPTKLVRKGLTLNQPQAPTRRASPPPDPYSDFSHLFVLQDEYHDPVTAALREDGGKWRAGGVKIRDEVWAREISGFLGGLEIQVADGTPEAMEMA